MNRSTRRLNLVRQATMLFAITASTFITSWRPASASSLSSSKLGDGAILVEILSDSPMVRGADDLPSGYHRISGADLSLLREAGRPEIPYRTFLVGLPEGKTIQITSRALATTRMHGYRLAPFIAKDMFGMERTPDGAALGFTWDELDAAEDRAVYDAAGAYPASMAVVQGIGVLRDQPVAEVRVYPVQYFPLSHELTHHGRIQVRVRFVDALGKSAKALSIAPLAGRLDPVATKGQDHLLAFESMMRGGLVNYDMVAEDRARRRGAASSDSQISEPVIGAAAASSLPAALGGPGMVKLSVTLDGLYQVSPAMLTSAGVDVSMLDPRTFHMTSGGSDISIVVEGESDGVFDPSDRVIFYGVGIMNDRYTKTNVYNLSFNGSAGPRVTSRSGSFTGAASTPASFTTTAHAEVNINYTSRIRVGVTEAWYWGVQTQGDAFTGTLTYPISLPRLDPAAHTLNVRARYLGLTSGNIGNHTPRLFLNNTQIAENSFGGEVNFTQSTTTASSLALSGSNDLKVTLLNVGNVGPDRVATDYFEIDYHRTYAVDGDQLMFDGEGAGTFHWSLSNLGSNSLLLMDVTTAGSPQSITVPAGQIVGPAPFTASFEDTLASDRAYVISTRTALKTPQAVTLDIPSSLHTAANGADYIIITDRSLLSAMQPLATFRTAQGLRTMVVATDDIYDEFNFGRSNPAAIRSFLTYAYTTWSQLPAPSYILLAGDGHIDYTGNFGGGPSAAEIVPPILRNIGGLEEPSDNDYAAVVGSDVFPEMFVGRLPIRTSADAGIMIANITAYETSPPVAALNDQSLYVADNDDPIFAAILNNLQDFMPPTMAAAEAYLPGGDPNDPPSQAQKDATTNAIVAGFNTGSLVSTYLGHGNVALWASERIFEHNPNPPTGTSARLDMTRLTNSGNLTFMVALNCINGYFVDLIPAGPGHLDFSLAEEFLRRSNRGAIGSWAPSALGQLSDYDSISYELFTHVFTDRMTTIGPATATALIDAVNVFGISPSNISSMHLFGDPAARLALDSDNDGLVDYRETAVGSNPVDADTDDDGVGDGVEVNGRGTSPINPDSDTDGLFDGTEIGVTTAGPGTDPNAPSFVPDADPNTTTNPINADTDGGGVPDGTEDANHNGRLDAGETDPNLASDDLACPGPLTEVTNLVVTRSGNDLVLSWDPSSVTCATYRIYGATNAPYPKSSFAPFGVIGNTSLTTFTHVGAAADPNMYDYLVRIVHPSLGLGPLGAYGQ